MNIGQGRLESNRCTAFVHIYIKVCQKKNLDYYIGKILSCSLKIEFLIQSATYFNNIENSAQI